MLRRWSPATRAQIGQAPVLPGVGFRTDSPTIVEDKEILELTGGRGFPLLGGWRSATPLPARSRPARTPRWAAESAALTLVEKARQMARGHAVAISAWSESRTQIAHALGHASIQAMSSNRQWWSDFHNIDAQTAPPRRSAEQITPRNIESTIRSPMDKNEFHSERTDVTRYAAASRYIEGVVSERVVRHCDRHGIFRDATIAGGFDALADELERRGLPFYDTWFDFEDRFGGIVWEDTRHERTEMSLGIYQCLSAPTQDQAAWRINSRQVAPDVWPTVRSGQAHLILAGAMDNFDDQLFVDERGVVYRLVGLLDELSAEAADGRVFLEKMAAEWEMHETLEESAPTTIDANVSEGVVDRLSLSLLDDASDAVSRVFRNDQLWVWQRLSFAPNTASMTLVARTPQAVVNAAKIALEIEPNAAISVRRDLPGGRERISALRAAGMKVREVF